MKNAPASLLLSPAICVLLLAFIVPIMLLLRLSLFDPGLTFAYFERAFTVPIYLKALGFTLAIAVISTILTLLLAYPLAYILVVSRPFARSVLLAIVMLPFWTNVLTRVYALILLLQNQGVVNTILRDWLHVTDKPQELVFNDIGMMYGLLHHQVPIAVLTLYAAMRMIDRRLLMAAESLGAHPVRAFWAVYFPLSAPALKSTGLLIFVISIGAYVIPALLGGPQSTMLAMIIADYYEESLQWGMGSALAVILLVVTVACAVVYRRLGDASSRSRV
ncbi:ABC transporter permease [Rhizobium lentis]|uniref:ABC transporter permease n=1 Tax=Rhizobium lentis TaxID=1138194 RepID=UPI001C82F09C|nr:ABC transporter permease [Rhizobium lentis]MBX5086777.1 ABC transporter permease [Rhizobium lentis]MBX5099422.1 ABC transporter permease [Rhizobium lentis]MBX5124339.1 ABC transporter permease [Rhizobium lentis]